MRDALLNLFLERFENWAKQNPHKVEEFREKLHKNFGIKGPEDAENSWLTLWLHIQKMAEKFRMTEEDFIESVFTEDKKHRLDFFTGEREFERIQ